MYEDTSLIIRTHTACRRISLDVFTHTLDLDLKFHLLRKTGEVMRIMDRGTSSIQNVLTTVIFSIGPQLFDILAACVYLAGRLDGFIAVIVFVTLVSYIPLTIYLTEWRGQFRRCAATSRLPAHLRRLCVGAVY